MLRVGGTASEGDVRLCCCWGLAIQSLCWLKQTSLARLLTAPLLKAHDVKKKTRLKYDPSRDFPRL